MSTNAILAAVASGLATAIKDNEVGLEAEAGKLTVTIEAGIVKIEGDAEGKLNPALKALAEVAVSQINPALFAEIPTAETDGLNWIVNELNAEAARLTAAG